MRRALLLPALLATASGCASVEAFARGDFVGGVRAVGQESVEGVNAANHGEEKAKRQCAGLDQQVVGLNEERAIGGAIAVGLADKYKAHVFLDGFSETNPVTVAADAAAGKISLPDSERNDLNAYVSQVGRNLAGYSSRPEIVWTFGVLDSPTVNAFSAPGGYVFVTTGLLKLIDNEAQLAGVLGHEIGHVSGRHALKGYGQVKLQQCLTATKWGSVVAEVGRSKVPSEFLAAAEWAKFFSGGSFDLDAKDMAANLIAKLTDGVVDAQVSSGNAAPDELAADRAAVELSAFAGYDASEYGRFLLKLPAGRDDHHPPMVERLAHMKTVRDGLAGMGAGAKPDSSAALKVVRK